MTTDIMPELLTRTEAMQLLRVSPSWLYDAAKDGWIPSIRPGGADGPVRFVRCSSSSTSRLRGRGGSPEAPPLTRCAARRDPPRRGAGRRQHRQQRAVVARSVREETGAPPASSGRLPPPAGRVLSRACASKDAIRPAV